MDQPRVSVFWHHRPVRKWLWDEFKDGRLRQGIGGPGMALIVGGEHVSADRWIAAAEKWHERWPPEKRKPDGWFESHFGMMRRMLELQSGDLVVVPRMPGEGEVGLAKVCGQYRFDDRHFVTGGQEDDFGHVIPIDPKSVRVIVIESLGLSLTPWRSHVNMIRDPRVALRLWEVFARSVLEPSKR